MKYLGEGNNIVLFKCKWFDTDRGIRVHRRHGLVDLKYKSEFARNEPFILAIQAHQLYYSPYPSSRRELKEWWAIINVKARDTYNFTELEQNMDATPKCFY